VDIFDCPDNEQKQKIQQMEAIQRFFFMCLDFMLRNESSRSGLSISQGAYFQIYPILICYADFSNRLVLEGQAES
jgi:hypothetical protein